MTDSLSLITAQISILEPPLVLIRIPISCYCLFLQPILQLLFSDDILPQEHATPWVNRHEFLNISITPLEVSIICHRDLATKCFVPVERAIAALVSGSQDKQVLEIVNEDYTVIQIDGEGMNAGQRVLELTGPLAMAGISIFFITTYFSDYILLPSRAKNTVTLALEQRGFVFSKAADAFVSQLSPSLQHGPSRTDYMSSGLSGWSPMEGRHPPSGPTTPPAKDIDELQSRTVKKLRKHHIQPQADEELRLVFCAGNQESSMDSDLQLEKDLLQILLSTQSGNQTNSIAGLALSDVQVSSGIPEHNFSTRFLSITITANEPVSILLEQRLLQHLGSSLMGAKGDDDVLIPITFDLQQLGFETTGIIGGVAGLLGHCRPRIQNDVSPNSERPEVPFDLDISFLSTAKSGTVMVKACQLESVLFELEQGYQMHD